MASHTRSYLIPVALVCAMGIVSAQADTWSSLQQTQPKAESAAVTTVSKPARNNANQLLFSEIELLKQEIQGLQARVEEQAYELRKIKKEQKERYLDLDRRIGEALKAGVSTRKTGKTVQGKPQYDAAFQLMKGKRLDDAAVAFKDFLQQYPRSSLVVNGYYWLGQIYYNQTNLDEARKAFTIVINQYPDHAKASDSKYKLAVILHRLGDSQQARRLLKAVVKQYADSASARFAKKYLKENFSK